jgi:two-component system alkaline phosphatase synthesis response regulator PhoP/two-component system response regulator VicR
MFNESDEHEIKKIKILVVDDDPHIRRLIRIILENKFSFQIIEAEDGRQALISIKQDKPFLIVLDVMMPEIDGFQVLKEIRKEEETKDLPVLICSAINERNKVLELYNQGIIDYIVKPINPVTFNNKITQYLKIYLSKIIKKVDIKHDVN